MYIVIFERVSENIKRELNSRGEWNVYKYLINSIEGSIGGKRKKEERG